MSLEEVMRSILLFFAYSFIGWAWETVYVSLKQKHFAYRGFLMGPITPIYGFAILGVLYLLEPFHKNVLLLFVGAVVVCTVLEYLTSFALEKLFHASWWDYHNVPLNINGRVALPISLFWGICCVGIVNFVQPVLNKLAEEVIEKFGYVLPILFTSIMLIDLVYTVYNMVGFRKAVDELTASIGEKRQEVETDLKELKEDIAKQRKNLEEEVAKRKIWLNDLKKHPEILAKIPRLNFHQKRWIRNFQSLDIKNSSLTREDIRSFIKELQNKTRL